MEYKKKLAALALVFILVNLAMNQILGVQWQWYIWAMHPFFWFVSLLIHGYLTSPTLTPQRFVNSFMASTGIKLAACAAAIGVLVYFNKAQARSIVIWFMLLYFGFSTFETIVLSKLARKK